MRAAIETFWNDIKRAQFIDAQTRAVTLTMDVRSNHMGVRSRVTFMWELTSMGAVLPSYDMETRVEAHAHRWATRFYLNIGLGFCGFFVVLELTLTLTLTLTRTLTRPLTLTLIRYSS